MVNRKKKATKCLKSLKVQTTNRIALFAVFLKYYHVELLAKLYEEQLRKIVLVQACVRRWLARVHYRRTRSRMAQSAMTVQRYVRGWLTRKRFRQMRCDWEQRQKEEQMRQHRKQSIKGRESEYNFSAIFFLLKMAQSNQEDKFTFLIPHLYHVFFSSLLTDMQQQVQKVLAKKKQEKHPFIMEDSHVNNNVADKPVDNIEKCNLN